MNFPHYDYTLEQLEAHYIAQVVEVCCGNLSEAARVLGIDRTSLQRKIKTKSLLGELLPPERLRAIRASVPRQDVNGGSASALAAGRDARSARAPLLAAPVERLGARSSPETNPALDGGAM